MYLCSGQGFWWGAAKNGELCGTTKLNCAAKKYQLCHKLCGSQFLISNVLRGAKWCFDWYFSLFKWWNPYYQLKSYKSCSILLSNRPKTMSHISSRKKYTPPPLLRIELLECIMYKMLHINLLRPGSNVELHMCRSKLQFRSTQMN